MPVAYTSYEAQVMAAAITMLANSATFQALLGVVTTAAAKSKIVEWDGGDPRQAGGPGKVIATDGTAFTLAPPYAQITTRLFNEDNAVAFGWTKRTGQLEIAIIVPLTVADTPPERIRRCANAVGGIASDIKAQFGTANCLAAGEATPAIAPLPEETGPLRGATVGTIALTWRNY